LIKYKKQKSYIKDTTQMRMLRLKELSHLQRAIFDAMACLPGIDSSAGWTGSKRSIKSAFTDLTGKTVSFGSIRGAINDLERLGLISVKKLSYHQYVYRINCVVASGNLAGDEVASGDLAMVASGDLAMVASGDLAMVASGDLATVANSNLAINSGEVASSNLAINSGEVASW
jgi:hypothetical protein